MTRQASDGAELAPGPGWDGDPRLRRVLSASDTGVWEWQAADDRIALSPEMRRILGMPPGAELVGRDILDILLAAQERERLERAAEAALAGDGRLRIDLRIRRADGEVRWLRVSGELERDGLGGAIQAFGIATDISKQKRLEQRLTVTDSVSRVLASATTLDEAVPRILSAIASGTSMEICGLWMPTPDGRELHCQSIHAVDGARARFASFLERTMETRLAPGEGLVGRVWQRREAQWVESIARERSLQGLRASALEGLESGVAFPLSSGRALLGVVEVFTSQTAPTDRLLLDTLAGMGNELGQFILRMRAETSLRESDIGQRLLVRIMQAHRETDDPETVMRDAAAALGVHLSASRVGFLEVVDEDGIEHLAGWCAPGVSPLSTAWPAAAIGRAYLSRIREGRAVAVHDAFDDPLMVDAVLPEHDVGAAIGVPITRGGRLSAAMYVHQRDPRHWSESEVRLAREVADHTWDAVERARAEAARRESEALTRTIAESSAHALVMMDEGGYVRYVNQAFLAMTGFDAAEIRARPLHELIHHHRPDGEPYPAEACPIGRALPDNVAMREHEDTFFRKDGSAFPVLCAVSPIRRTGTFDATIIEIRDVSATRAAAEALRASEQRFRATFENAAVGVAHVAPDGRWLRVNERLCQITGYSESELLARTFQDITHPDDLSLDLAHVRRVLEGEIDTYSIEKRYLRKDGETIWVDLTVSLVRRGDGEPDHFISVVVDIGSRKLVESQLRKALAAKDEFLGLVSHELRTPMTVILGMSQMLAGKRLDPAQVYDAAGDIASSAFELNELIESMLLLARLDGHAELVSEPLLLARSARQALERQRQRDRVRHYEVETSVDSLVHGHPGLIDRLISNLLSNAAKYSAPGGRVQLIVESGDGEIRLRVLDEGPGLDDEELIQIFDPFYRAPGAQDAPGLGLGLTVAQRVVDAMGGRIWATRRPSQGSEFGFALPKLDPETA